MTKAVLAAFRAEQKGVTATNWQPIRIETSDAAGNHAQLSSWSNTRQNGESVMTYQWGLWPDESPWKLRVEFSKQSGFSDDEAVDGSKSSGESRQPAGNVEQWPQQPDETRLCRNNLERNSFENFPRDPVHKSIWGKWRQARRLPGSSRSTAGRDAIELVKATSDSGRDLPSYSGSSWGGTDRQFQMQNMRNTQTMTVTLALVKSRFIEFTVKPEKAAAAAQ